MSESWIWISLAGCLAWSFFLNGMEAGVQSLSRLRIRQWLRTGRSGARSLLDYLDKPENFLWTILVGNTLATFAVVCLILAELQTRWGNRPLVFWPLLFGAGSIVFVLTDLLPKTLFRRFPNHLCLNLVSPFKLVHFTLTPLVRLVEHFAALLLRFTRGQALSGRLFGNRDELRALLKDSGAALVPGERALINRVLDAQNTTVARIATPLSDVPRLTTTSPLEDFLEIARNQQRDRMPVWDTDPRTPRIQGVITLRRVIYETTASQKTCGDFLAPTVFLDESLRLDEALRRLQRSGSQMGIVLAPDRRERGFVTIEQLLQNLMGEVSA